MTKRKDTTIDIDGSRGEGGGQVVRVAISLAAITSQAVRVDNIRAGRPKGGGLKNQHVTAIEYLASATQADVEGLEIGSKSIVFRPTLAPSALANRYIKIVAPTEAASTSLIFQAVLPFLVHASDPDDADKPISLTITGGTNVGFSPSYEYLAQVLLPTLRARYGILVEPSIESRAWAAGPSTHGCVHFTIHPLKPGQKLQPLQTRHELASLAASPTISRVDVSIIVPGHLQAAFQDRLASDLAAVLPAADVDFVLLEDSGHDARVYVLLVAHSAHGNFRWGRDTLASFPKKPKAQPTFVRSLSSSLVRDLYREVAAPGGTMGDEYLQDQLVIFQALAEGESAFFRHDEKSAAYLEDERMRKDRGDEPFGQGSMHAQTARWVASEMLPAANFFNKGTVCAGVGFPFP
ncbi:RNA 3'-terminal phosphate cyclase [Plectosphaerella plurivora]|uniref:RNA 3'-terminal phosphate cyclase n=1 Tax=Plectosphaerella plurivora TaxID=936078 RepID=A0A9P8V9U0_9PEZI|nr:RNA 3'-terminal phosphate cyclase [Plectosphaerella plurivora]